MSLVWLGSDGALQTSQHNDSDIFTKPNVDVTFKRSMTDWSNLPDVLFGLNRHFNYVQ